MSTYWKIAIAGSISGLLLLAAATHRSADDEPANDEPAEDIQPVEEVAAPPPVHIVERGDLTLSVERSGRLESAEAIKVRIAPEAYNGPLEFIEVNRDGGRVEEGEVLFRFDPSRLDEALRSAQESLKDQAQRLEHARSEQTILAESNARRIEQAEKAFADAQQDLDFWENYLSPRMLEAAELSMRGSENNVHNQREELNQLEMMYEGTELATETKEIVLDRARRSLAIAEGWLEVSRKDYTVTTEASHPRQDRDRRDAVRFRGEELEHLRVNTAIAEARKAIEIIGIERSIRDSNERIAKLEADREQLIVTAPASGLMSSNEYQPGDTAGARQVLAEIMDPQRKVLSLNLTAEDLRVLKEGDDVNIVFPDYPEIEVAGSIREIALIGQPTGEGTNFPAVVDVEAGNPLVRLGLRGAVSAERVLPRVVLVPRDAVEMEAGRAFVSVRATDEAEPERRRITIGASNDEFYQVVSGLEPGELVEIPEE